MPDISVMTELDVSAANFTIIDWDIHQVRARINGATTFRMTTRHFFYRKVKFLKTFLDKP
jgi:hypothetical protein